MEATDPLSALLQRARSTLDTLAANGPGANLQLATKSELEALRKDIAQLERHLAAVERRVDALERTKPSPKTPPAR